MSLNGMLVIRAELTKDYLLSKVSQEQIFSHYLGISIQSIQYCTLNKSHKINNPMRVDKNPSLGFQYNSRGQLKMRDFSGYFCGDVFDLVGFLINKKPSIPSDFKHILKHIATELDIYSIDFNKQYDYTHISFDIKKRAVIEIELRDWNSSDLNFWSRYAIRDFDYLTSNHVYPVSRAWINSTDNPTANYNYRVSDPCYCYFFGINKEDGLPNYQLYFPYRGKDTFANNVRFITNYSSLYGVINLKPNRPCLITKSYKDVLVLKLILNKLLDVDISILALSSEATIDDSIARKLIEYCRNKIYTLFDNDLTGIRLSNKCKREYGFIPLVIFDKDINGIRMDISDYVKNNGLNETIKLVNNAREQIYNEETRIS